MANSKPYQFKYLLIFHILLQTLFKHVAPKPSNSSLKLIPWDSPKSHLYQPNLTQTQKIHAMVESSRLRAIPISSPIQIPTRNNFLRYSVKIKLGSPPKYVSMVLSTGSDFTWTQCQTCSLSICNPPGVKYNPKKSVTFKYIPCSDQLCTANEACKCVQGKCQCTLHGAVGLKPMKFLTVLGFDRFYLRDDRQTVSFYDIIFGCTSESPLEFPGILSLDRSLLSITSQMGKAAKGRFSYCVHREGGYLSFGDEISPFRGRVKTTPLVYPHEEMMHLNLMGVSVANSLLNLPPDQFSLDHGGFVIDTGTQITILKENAMDQVKDAITSYYNNIGKYQQFKSKKYPFEVCFRHNPMLKPHYAAVTFHLEGGDYVVDKSMYIAPEKGILCVAMVGGARSILGMRQQWNTRFIFDISANLMQFALNDC